MRAGAGLSQSVLIPWESPRFLLRDRAYRPVRNPSTNFVSRFAAIFRVTPNASGLDHFKGRNTMLRLGLIAILLLGTSASSSAQSTGATVVGIKPAVQVDTGTWSEG